jgi:hypothetical protein
MNVRIKKQEHGVGAIDLSKLPSRALNELSSFYEFLLFKYHKKARKDSPEHILKGIEKLSWNMGKKLFKDRSELYER